MFGSQGAFSMGAAGANQFAPSSFRFGESPGYGLSFSQGPLTSTIDTNQMVNTPSFGGSGGGLNGMQIGGLALGGLQTLAGLYSAFQANKLAKKQFKFTRDFSLTNLRNSAQDYNTKLEDRARTRAFTEGRDSASADAYIQKNKLSSELAKFGK